MMQYVVLALLVSACVYHVEAYPTYGYEADRYQPYQPRNQFGKLVVRNKNNNENQNDEAVENDNGVDSENANNQEQLRLRSNERYDINRYGYNDGYESDGYYGNNYNSDDDSDAYGYDEE